MSTSNRSWLGDAKLPDEIVFYRYEALNSINSEGKTVRETNVRIQLREGTKEDRCLELITAVTKVPSGFKREVNKTETNAGFALVPTITSRIIDTEV